MNWALIFQGGLIFLLGIFGLIGFFINGYNVLGDHWIADLITISACGLCAGIGIEIIRKAFKKEIDE